MEPLIKDTGRGERDVQVVSMVVCIIYMHESHNVQYNNFVCQQTQHLMYKIHHTICVCG